MNPYYINRAIMIAEESDKLLQSVTRCLKDSKVFPIYLSDLQALVDNLCYLNVANNAATDERFRLEKKKEEKREKKRDKKRKHIKKK